MLLGGNMTHKVWCRSSAFLAAAVAIECLRHLHWHVQPAQHGSCMCGPGMDSPACVCVSRRWVKVETE